MARLAVPVVVIDEHGAVHVQRVDGVGQLVPRVGIGVAGDAVLIALLGGVPEEDQAMVRGQAHQGVLQRVARGAAAVVGVEVGVVPPQLVGGNRLHEVAVAVGVAARRFGLGVGFVLLGVLVEIGQRCHAVDEAALGGEPAERGQLVGTVAGLRARLAVGAFRARADGLRCLRAASPNGERSDQRDRNQHDQCFRIAGSVQACTLFRGVFH